MTERSEKIKYSRCASLEHSDTEEPNRVTGIVSSGNVIANSTKQQAANSGARNSTGMDSTAVQTSEERAPAPQSRFSAERRPSRDFKVALSTARVGPKSGANSAHRAAYGMSRLSANEHTIFGTFARGGHLFEPSTPRHIRRQRRKEIAKTFGRKRHDGAEMSSGSKSAKPCCRCSLVFDPAGRLAYWWSFVISIAFLYNFWAIVYRFAFDEIKAANMVIWLPLDYACDLLYALDIAFSFRTGYLDDGVLQTDGTKLRTHYMNSTVFYVDCLCLLPLDFLYLSFGFKSMLRCFRLLKIYRFWEFLDRTERHTNYPNVVRTVTLLHYLFAVYHWNACLMYMTISTLQNKNWTLDADENDVFATYLHSLYWSTLTLSMVGGVPMPQSKEEYLFIIVEFVLGLLLFAAILGHVANIVTSISAARKEFQAKLDNVKTYMMLRHVPLRLQDRVIKWFDYLWFSKKSSDEEKTLGLLPNKLKAEIALHVHLDTLKRVEIFQNTEAGFLCDLVLRLRPVLFSPGDFICRKGEVGKEMYIVSRGRLQVVSENGKAVLATLRPGSYFGEISILNMGSAGNRRTASVRSVGYSDLFCLSKNDLWEVLKDYPTARVRLEATAIKRLKKYKNPSKDDYTCRGLRKSKSSPGMVESAGMVPIEMMHMRYAPRCHREDNDNDRGPSSGTGASGLSDAKSKQAALAPAGTSRPISPILESCVVQMSGDGVRVDPCSSRSSESDDNPSGSFADCAPLAAAEDDSNSPIAPVDGALSSSGGFSDPRDLDPQPTRRLSSSFSVLPVEKSSHCGRNNPGTRRIHALAESCGELRQRRRQAKTKAPSHRQEDAGGCCIAMQEMSELRNSLRSLRAKNALLVGELTRQNAELDEQLRNIDRRVGNLVNTNSTSAETESEHDLGRYVAAYNRESVI